MSQLLLRWLLSFIVLIISLLWGLYWFYQGRFSPIPLPEVRVVLLDPYVENPLLHNYRQFRDALINQDVLTLHSLLAEPSIKGTYLEYQIALTLARLPSLAATQRLPYYQQALNLHLKDPLAANAERELWLEHAQVAEQAGNFEVAQHAYSEALPFAEAITGIKRVATNAYKLANDFYKAKMYTAALEALGTNTAPSIAAPAYRWTNQNSKALEAYENWLVEAPDDVDASLGKAWILYRLGRYTEADTAFAELIATELGVSEAFFGRALIAEKQGDIEGAINFYLQTGRSKHLWKATTLLEQNGKIAEAIKVYLKIAQFKSDYQDDAAFRAWVLAKRQGDTEAVNKAEILLPKVSFFQVAKGNNINIPFGVPLPIASHPTIDLAKALEGVNDYQAAIGELTFALKTARAEATVVAIASELQRLGEYRQSSRAAEKYLYSGTWNLRTWQLAYPKAYYNTVYSEALLRDLEPQLIWAVMREESRFYPRAISWANAKGLMQFINSTWVWMAELLNEPPADPFTPTDNIRYGAYYLKWLLDYFDGDIELVIPSYNGGQGYIRRLYENSLVAGDKEEFYRHIDKNETREYLQKVLLSYEIYKIIHTN